MLPREIWKGVDSAKVSLQFPEYIQTSRIDGYKKQAKRPSGKINDHVMTLLGKFGEKIQTDNRLSRSASRGHPS